MKIASYNINGIRASARLGLLDWIRTGEIDVFCLQEIRANESIARSIFSDDTQLSLFSDPIADAPASTDGYYKYYNCGKIAGYAGTMILSKIQPDRVEYDMGEIWSDDEGRVTTAFFGDLAVVNAYIPNGNSRLDFKMQFLAGLTVYLAKLKEAYSVVCVGDFNIANDEIDLTNPRECRNKSVFLPIERDAFKRILSLGYVDSFRYLYPDKVEYSWRSYRSRQESLLSTNYNAWKYRIDYAIVYNKANYAIRECTMPDLAYSDHLPVVLTIEKEQA